MSIKESIRKWLLDDDRKVNAVHLGDQPSLTVSDSPSPHSMNRTFTITEAMNGSYITFQKRKYNPNGPDDFRHEVYLVQPGESLVDAISTVLVLTEK